MGNEEETMLKDSNFYAGTLGLEVTENPAGLGLELATGGTVSCIRGRTTSRRRLPS
jgi:hypothetical protein